MEKLSSIDYAHIIQYVTQRNFNVELGKTQVLKLLFMCYGLYLAKENKRLFDDDTPKVWPLGPVFPRVFRTFDKNNAYIEPDECIKSILSQDKTAFSILKTVVVLFHGVSATELSEWSHRSNGPWQQTINEKGENFKWNDEINDDLVKKYFHNYIDKIQYPNE